MRYQKALKTATIGLFVLVLGLLIVPVGSVLAWSDNFDSYEAGPLEGLGGWDCNNPPYDGQVDAGAFYSSPNSASHLQNNCRNLFTSLADQTIIATAWINSAGYDGNIGLEGTEATRILTTLNCSGGTCFWEKSGGGTMASGISKNAWHKYQILYNETTGKFQGAVDDGEYSAELDAQSTGNVDTFYVLSPPWSWGTWYLDDVEVIPSGPPVMYITATAPATGSTITDTTDTLTIDYFNVDPPYTGFTIGFQDNIIFSNSESVLFNTTGSGTEVISLADFGITTNGHWDLKGFAFGTHLDIQDGFLTTRGYIDFFSDQLVDPAYYLLFNVAGLETPYTFTEPTDWYTANVDRFPSPTAFFTDFTGLLDPLFLKIAEFGRQVEPMFDKQGAYDRGYALGEVFPFIGAYVDAINVFFGGFPMVGFFIAIILIMIAMFVIRTIIKFIPFKGN